MSYCVFQRENTILAESFAPCSFPVMNGILAELLPCLLYSTMMKLLIQVTAIIKLAIYFFPSE